MKINYIFYFLAITVMCCTSQRPKSSTNEDGGFPLKEIDGKNSSKAEKELLSELSQEITMMATGTKCENPAEWKTIGVGSKACGGPNYYLAYSTKINETIFLQKVATYNAKTAAYNKKHNVMSDCMLVEKPEQIYCEKGKAIFIK